MDTPTCKTCQYAPLTVTIGCRGVCWARDDDEIAFPDRPACELYRPGGQSGQLRELYRPGGQSGQLREIAADALKTIAELKVILELPPEASNQELILAVMRRL